MSMGLQSIGVVCFASLNLLDDGRSNAGSGSQANVCFPPHAPDGGGLGDFGEHSRQHFRIGRKLSNLKSFSKTSKMNMGEVGFPFIASTNTDAHVVLGGNHGVLNGLRAAERDSRFDARERRKGKGGESIRLRVGRAKAPRNFTTFVKFTRQPHKVGQNSDLGFNRGVAGGRSANSDSNRGLKVNKDLNIGGVAPISAGTIVLLTVSSKMLNIPDPHGPEKGRDVFKVLIRRCFKHNGVREDGLIRSAVPRVLRDSCFRINNAIVRAHSQCQSFLRGTGRDFWGVTWGRKRCLRPP